MICLPFPQESAAQVEAIYWVEQSPDESEVGWAIRRADPDGQNVTAVYELRDENLNGSWDALGQVIASRGLDAVFFVEIRQQHNISVVQTGLHGESPTTVFGHSAPFAAFVAFRVLGERRQILYVEDSVADQLRHIISFVAVDTGERLPSLVLPTWIVDFVVDESTGKLYWARPSGIDTFSVGIYRANMDGSNIELVVDRRASALALDTRQRKLYWSHSGEGVFRSNLNGSEIEQLVTGPSLRIATEVVDGILYWTEANTIYRANADDLRANDSASPEVIHVSEHTIQRPVILAGERSSNSSPYMLASTLGVSVFPNPASDIVFASFETALPVNVVVSLFTMIGARVGRVYSGRVYNGQRIELDVSHLARGTYLLHVRSETEEVISRVIVKR